MCTPARPPNAHLVTRAMSARCRSGRVSARCSALGAFATMPRVRSPRVPRVIAAPGESAPTKCAGRPRPAPAPAGASPHQRNALLWRSQRRIGQQPCLLCAPRCPSACHARRSAAPASGPRRGLPRLHRAPTGGAVVGGGYWVRLSRADEPTRLLSLHP